jgi:membrane protein required for colicin V production
MTWFDWAVIAIQFASGAFGYLRGFVQEAIALATWLAGIWFAWRFGGALMPMLGEWDNVPELRIWAARAIIFIIVLMIGGMLGWLVRKLVQSAGMTKADRTLGTIFGLLRGAILVGLVVIGLRLSGADAEPWWLGAELREYCEQAADIVMFYAQLGGEYLQENYNISPVN